MERPPFSVDGSCPLLQVFDMLESIAFYCDRLGFSIERQSPPFDKPYEYFNWAVLRRDNVELMLNTAYDGHERPPARDPARTAAHADTILYFGCPDVDAAYAAIVAAGIPADPPLVSHDMKGFGISDPDGYHLHFHWPAKDS